MGLTLKMQIVKISKMYTYKVVINGRIAICILHRHSICDLYIPGYLINYALLSFLIALLLHD